MSRYVISRFGLRPGCILNIPGAVIPKWCSHSPQPFYAFYSSSAGFNSWKDFSTVNKLECLEKGSEPGLGAVDVDIMNLTLSKDNEQIGTSILDLSKTYINYSLPKLALSTFIMKFCQRKWWIDNLAPRYLTWSYKMPGMFYLPNRVVKATFFNQFCGGENGKEVKSVTNRLSAFGIGAILDPAMEEDLVDIHDPIAKENLGRNLNFNLVTSPSSFANKDVMTDRLRVIKECIDMASPHEETLSKETSPQFLALKVTCLMPTGLMYQLTSALDRLIGDLDPLKKGLVTEATWQAYMKYLTSLELPESSQTTLHAMISYGEKLFATRKAEGNDQVVYTRGLAFGLSPNQLLDYYFHIYLPSLHKQSPSETSETFYAKNTGQALVDRIAALREEFENSLVLIDEIVQYAAKKQVCLMIDAEQTYFQSSIHYLTKEMIRRADSIIRKRTYPIVYYTYQMYLKDGLYQLRSDLLHAAQENRSMGIKLVRGAYMDGERKRALDLQLQLDPINDTIQDTHANYFTGMTYILDRIRSVEVDPANRKKISLLIATHNKDTLERALLYLKQQKLSLPKAVLSFGQLLGMSDHLTFSLARLGFSSYKYVPIGTVHEILPYLIRRAQENSSILGRAAVERQQLSSVLAYRLGIYSNRPSA